MTAGIIERCGAFGGRTIGPNDYNKRGMYENREIRDNIVKPYLTLCGADPRGQHPLPNVNRLIPVGNLRAKVEQVMKFHGYQDGPWYYKCAKACLIWPVFHEAFPEARWVIVRRRDEDIINSCLHTAFMNSFKTADGWQGWIDHHKARFKEMTDAKLQIFEVWPTRFVFGDLAEIRAAVEWLGLRWNEEAVTSFVSKDLWKGKQHGTQSDGR
jgi:hypothetical protein